MSRIGKRPSPRSVPARLTAEQRDYLAARADYVGSRKHKFGLTPELGIGQPGRNPVTVAQAQRQEPVPPYTMMCPEKWNRRRPSEEATDLLREAIRRGQFDRVEVDGVPKHVYVRDPEDATIVYNAHRMATVGERFAYKAYPLTESQIRLLKVDVP